VRIIDPTPVHPHGIPVRSRWRSGARTPLRVSLAMLALLGWVWIASAAQALWQLATTVDELLVWATHERTVGRAADIAPLAGVPAPPRGLPTSAAPAAPSKPSELQLDTRSSTPVARSVAEHSEAPSPIGMPSEITYRGASCTGLFVYIVTVSERSPRHSAVSFATSSDARARFARPGQVVEQWEVLAITEDWTGHNPVVWLLRAGEVCRAGLTGNPARLQAALAARAAQEAQVAKEAKRKQRLRRRRRRAR
jgi:hypothetical protein